MKNATSDTCILTEFRKTTVKLGVKPFIGVKFVKKKRSFVQIKEEISSFPYHNFKNRPNPKLGKRISLYYHTSQIPMDKILPFNEIDTKEILDKRTLPQEGYSYKLKS